MSADVVLVPYELSEYIIVFPCHYLLRVFSHACPYALRISSIVMRPWYSPPLNFTERSMSLLFPEWQAVFFLPLAIVRSQAFLIVS